VSHNKFKTLHGLQTQLEPELTVSLATLSMPPANQQQHDSSSSDKSASLNGANVSLTEANKSGKIYYFGDPSRISSGAVKTLILFFNYKYQLAAI
jgi:hypothetical protein